MHLDLLLFCIIFSFYFTALAPLHLHLHVSSLFIEINCRHLFVGSISTNILILLILYPYDA